MVIQFGVEIRCQFILLVDCVVDTGSGMGLRVGTTCPRQGSRRFGKISRTWSGPNTILSFEFFATLAFFFLVAPHLERDKGIRAERTQSSPELLLTDQSQRPRRGDQG